MQNKFRDRYLRTMKNIADYSRKIRKSKKISQSELAEFAGVCRNTIYKFEAHCTYPRIKTLDSIARALGLDLVLFLNCGDELKGLSLVTCDENGEMSIVD